MDYFNFGAASEEEQIVFGAQRPGYNSSLVNLADIQNWISFMKKQGIRRVCCLLTKDQLEYYEVDLLEEYGKEFGKDNVCWAPVKDYHLCDSETLHKILYFLKEADAKGERVVVHCSGGSGRTGHVLAAWLVFKRGLSEQKALETVLNMGRNPYEAINCGNATKEDLYGLLRQFRKNNLD